MTEAFDRQVLELVLSAGLDGIKASTIVDRLRSSTGLVRHALLRLEVTGQVERTRRRGKNLLWGPVGVAARHKIVQAEHRLAYDRERAKAKREQRAIESIGDPDGDLLPVQRIVIPAHSAPPLHKPCAASAWELGTYQ